ncbi:MAG: type III toxin-antitoxin system ToxN/AbiQ family toxin [Lachnospiraceae bacterium]|nr:type III toxin-antitoxin system ToxN/AbiQ family toxin [Lachnospiraceae bacterium]
MEKSQLDFYKIDMKYIRNLHHLDDRVFSVSPQIGKSDRPFLGLVVVSNGRSYCIPLSAPKEKHKFMRNRIDFIKMVEDDKLLGVLNLNLMIPVQKAQLQKIDISVHKHDRASTVKRKEFLAKELAWCREHEREITNAVNVLYQAYTSNAQFAARKNCLDFPTMEKACDKYNQASR